MLLLLWLLQRSARRWAYWTWQLKWPIWIICRGRPCLPRDVCNPLRGKKHGLWIESIYFKRCCRIDSSAKIDTVHLRTLQSITALKHNVRFGWRADWKCMLLTYVPLSRRRGTTSSFAYEVNLEVALELFNCAIDACCWDAVSDDS